MWNIGRRRRNRKSRQGQGGQEHPRPAADAGPRDLPAAFLAAQFTQRDAAERFAEKVDRNGPDGPHGRCHLWTGATNKGGYGVFWAGGKTVLAHRWAFEAEHGPIPLGLYPDHRCHTDHPDCPPGPCVHRACVRTDHLELVTDDENRRRARARVPNVPAETRCRLTWAHGNPVS